MSVRSLQTLRTLLYGLRTALLPPAYAKPLGRWSSRALVGLVFLGATVAYTAPILRRGELNAPPSRGDGPDYDAIALQLTKGHGFSYNWDDPEFLAPYVDANHSGDYDYLLSRSGAYATTYRPPLLPTLMAGTYLVAGRQFALIRLINVLAMALTGTIVFTVALQRFGRGPALIFAVLFLIVDPQTRRYARLILTESLACLFVALMIWSMLLFAERRRVRWALISGTVVGLAALLRSAFALWSPMLALFIYLEASSVEARTTASARIRSAAIFVAALLVITSPWQVRNSLLLRQFSPFGTQGAINISAGYSPYALENKGIHAGRGETGFFDVIYQTVGPSTETEKAMAEYSQSFALQWVVENPQSVPLLAYYKTIALWQLRSLVGQLVLLFALTGLLLLGNRVETRLFATILAAITFSVALTWSVGGRFLLPGRSVILVLVALTIWAILRGAFLIYSWSSVRWPRSHLF
jgi:4-amino-4-deoxy-L-arabinose transferase-like glycosyltransferase